MFEALERLDRVLFLKVNGMHSPFMDGLMWQLSESWHTYILIGLVGLFFYRKHSRKKAAEFLLGCALIFACTDFSANLVKHNVKRYRPTHNTEIKEQVHFVNDYKGGQYGFFSSHAANVFGITTFIFLCLSYYPKKYRWLFFIYPLIVCYSRMYLGVHYPGDIFAGMLDGVLFGILGYYVVNRFFLKLNEKAS